MDEVKDVILRAEHISKTFGTNKVLHDIDFETKTGEVICIIGASGSGKSTLLRCINYLETPTSGAIMFHGEAVSSHGRGVTRYRSQVGMVFQSFNLFANKTVLQNCMTGTRKVLKKSKEEAEELAMRYLTKVGMAPYIKAKPSQLSGGQQQRVALARALVAEPGLLLLDEPLSNLDAKLRESMRFEIKELQRKLGVTVVYVTHDQAEAMAMSDRIIVMYKGVIQQIDVPTQIYEHPANPTVADFIGLVNFLEGEAEPGVIHFNKLGCSLPVEVSFAGPARVAVRPEHITMSKTSGPLRGKLLHKIYLGDSTDWRIAVGDTVLRVIDRGLSFDEYVDSEEVFLSFGHVMAFPQ